VRTSRRASYLLQLGEIVSNTDRIGLPSFLEWLVSGPWAATAFAWILTPVGLYVVAYVFESRLVGKDFHPWRGAFRGFMPGDLLLGASFGQFVWQLGKFESRSGWWSEWWWHAIAGVGAVVVAFFVREGLDRPNYHNLAMKSPSKLYHDFVIYMGFGYVFFTTAVAATFTTGWHETLLLPYGLLAGWAVCVFFIDGRKTRNELRRLAWNSHPTSWTPIWR
jgi:hypothetical protein